MRILPYYHETLVLPFTSDKVIQILSENTIHPVERNSGHQKKFVGMIEAESFRISEKLNRPDNFIPLIKGSIEKTSKGSIIFTSYNLLFSTALFVSFSSVVTMLLCLLFLFQFNNNLYAIISMAAFIFNYYFTSTHFHRKVKGSRRAFYSLFTE